MTPAPGHHPRLHEAPANVYAVVYRALLWGMVVSSMLFAAGVVLSLQRHIVISMGAPATLGWTAFWHNFVRFDPTALMQAATIVLILTPVARVVVAFVTFWLDHDRKFVYVTGIVLAVIILTVILGRLGLH